MGISTVGRQKGRFESSAACLLTRIVRSAVAIFLIVVDRQITSTLPNSRFLVAVLAQRSEAACSLPLFQTDFFGLLFANFCFIFFSFSEKLTRSATF